ncbi:hypothetical protein D5085_10320 [Ectothiorhodospiraceae bacterium BW-2]|nr:hypothetical protein D5085_10320 [Ectothiorhodospiraceae bacterium BW-2]
MSINYIVGFLTGYFESVNKGYDEFFFHTVRSNLILFGYKDGNFFDNQYETEEKFNEALQEVSSPKVRVAPAPMTESSGTV